MKKLFKRILMAFRNEVVLMGLVGLVAVALGRADIVAIPNEWQVYVEFGVALLAALGFFIDPKTAGFTDDERNLGKELMDFLTVIAKVIAKSNKKENK